MNRNTHQLPWLRLSVFISTLLISTAAYPHGEGSADECHDDGDPANYHCHRQNPADDPAFRGDSQTATLFLVTSLAVTFIIFAIKNKAAKRGWKDNKPPSSKPHPKFIITPYLDNNKYGIQWEAPIHP